MKEYHISIFKGFQETPCIVLTQNINRKGIDFINEDPHNAWKKQYILEVGDKVIDIFGNLVTIKKIIHHYNTKPTNYLVEENNNCYCPHEFAGLFVKYLTQQELKALSIINI